MTPQRPNESLDLIGLFVVMFVIGLMTIVL